MRQAGALLCLLLLSSILVFSVKPTLTAQSTRPRIAIIDSGVAAAHPALAGRVIVQKCFISTGKVSDSCPDGVYGADTAPDANGSGTFMAGIIAPHADIIAVRVLNPQGKLLQSIDLENALDWLIQQQASLSVKAVVIGQNQYSTALPDGFKFANYCDANGTGYENVYQRLDQLRQLGVTTFAAVGDNAETQAAAFPGCFSNLIAVGNVYDGSYGAYNPQPTIYNCTDNTTLDLVACDSNTFAKSNFLLSYGGVLTSANYKGGTKTGSGTSYAAATAGAIIAQLLQTDPYLTPAQLQNLFASSSVSVADPRTSAVYPRIDLANTQSTMISARPAAPDNVTVSGVTRTQVTVAWADTNTSIDRLYAVERSTDQQNWQIMNRAAGTSFTDTTLLCQTTYYYRLYTEGSFSNSTVTPTVSAKTVDCTPPPAPQNLQAVLSDTGVHLTWQSDTGSNLIFKVQRSTDGQNWAEITQTAALNHTDTSIMCGVNYTYRVTTSSPGGVSPASNTASASRACPLAPVSLTAAATSTRAVQLVWTDPAPGVTQEFTIERQTTGGWQTLAKVFPPTASYIDLNRVCHEVYTYRVTALVNGSTSPAAQAVVSPGETFVCPPTGLTATLNSDFVISLTWNNHAGENAIFSLQRSTNGVDWSVIQQTNMMNYTDINLTCGTSYSYRVVAQRNVQSSEPSAAASVRTAECPNVVELVQNGSFEADVDGDRKPDQWQLKVTGKDKRKCNNDNKTFAHTGQCAFMLKGQGIGKKLQQKLSIAGVTEGSTVVMQAWMQVKREPIGVKLTLKVTYTDGTSDVLKPDVNVSLNQYTALQSQLLITKPVQAMQFKVKLSKNAIGNRFLLDGVSVRVLPAVSLESQ